jgi:hypothetical protein
VDATGTLDVFAGVMLAPLGSDVATVWAGKEIVVGGVNWTALPASGFAAPWLRKLKSA